MRGRVQGRVLQHDADLQGDGRQHLQVLVAERHPGCRAVELDDALAVAVRGDQRHAQERAQVQLHERLTEHHLRVAGDVLAQDADALVQGAADDGAAVGGGVAGLGPAAAQGAQHQPVALAQQHQPAVGLREQAQQVVEQLAQQRLQLQRAGQRLGDLQHHLELVRRVLQVQRVVRGRGRHTGTDDLVGLGLEAGAARAAGRGRTGQPEACRSRSGACGPRRAGR